MSADNITLLYVIQLGNPSIEADFVNVSAVFDGTTLKILTNLGKEYYHEFKKSETVTFEINDASNLVVVSSDDLDGLHSHYESEHEYHMLVLSHIPDEWIAMVN